MPTGGRLNATFRLAKLGFAGLFLCKLHPAFHCAQRLQVLVDLPLVRLANATLETLRLVVDKIDHALVGHSLLALRNIRS